MSGLIHRLQIYRGEPLDDCIDKIGQMAAGFTINVMDPSFNRYPIDNNNGRLNVKTNNSGIITGFTIG